MLAGAEVAIAVNPSGETAGQTQLAEVETRAALSTDTGSISTQAANEIALIDSDVESHEELTVPVRRGGGEIVVIDSASDPLAQMNTAITRRSNLRTIHVVSHGDSGRLRLGGQTIDSERLHDNASLVESWAAHLTLGADILLYGCDVGSDAGKSCDECLLVLAHGFGLGSQ